MSSKGPRGDRTCRAGGRLGEKLGTLHPQVHVAGSGVGLEFPCWFPRLRMKQCRVLEWPEEIGDDLFLTDTKAAPD